MNRLLIIEDEEIILKALTRLLERNGYEVCTAMTVEAAIAEQPQSFDLILADLRLPGAEGTSIIPVADPIPVVIMTSHASVRSAVKAMRNGAIDYIAKPFDHDELLLVIERSLMQNRLFAQNLALEQDLNRQLRKHDILRGATVNGVLSKIGELRSSQRFLLLYGEPGTNKEHLARKLHQQSDRQDAPLVVADCPSTDSASMRTLFLGGKTPSGVPTSQPSGLLQAAHKGTLILRYVHVIPLSIQREIAEVLLAGSVVGTAGKRTINVRVIAISYCSVAELLSAKQLDPLLASLFKDDEYPVPSLREQRNDVISLANATLFYYQQRHNQADLHFSDNSIAVLLAYDWPGNGNEFTNAIERAVLLCTSKIIRPADLGLGVLESAAPAQPRDLSLDEYFRFFVYRHQSELSETELANRLGISRKALWERRQKMQLPRKA